MVCYNADCNTTMQDTCHYTPVRCKSEESHSCVSYSYWSHDPLFFDSHGSEFGVAVGTCRAEPTPGASSHCSELRLSETSSNNRGFARWTCDECRTDLCNPPTQPPLGYSSALSCNQATCTNSGTRRSCVYISSPCNDTDGSAFSSYCITYSFQLAFWGVVTGFAGGICAKSQMCNLHGREMITSNLLGASKIVEDWTCDECSRNNCNAQTQPSMGVSRSCNQANCVDSPRARAICTYEARPCESFLDSCVTYSYAQGSGTARFSYAKGMCASSADPACSLEMGALDTRAGAVTEWKCEQCTSDNCNAQLPPPNGVQTISGALQMAATGVLRIVVPIVLALTELRLTCTEQR